MWWWSHLFNPEIEIVRKAITAVIGEQNTHAQARNNAERLEKIRDIKAIKEHILKQPEDQRSALFTVAAEKAYDIGDVETANALKAFINNPMDALKNEQGQTFYALTKANDPDTPLTEAQLRSMGLSGTPLAVALAKEKALFDKNPFAADHIRSATASLKTMIAQELKDMTMTGQSKHDDAEPILMSILPTFKGKYALFTKPGSGLDEVAAYRKALGETKLELAKNFADPTNDRFIKTHDGPDGRSGNPLIIPEVPNIGRVSITNPLHRQVAAAKRLHGADYISKHQFITLDEAEQTYRNIEAGKSAPRDVLKTALYLYGKNPDLTPHEIIDKMMEAHNIKPPQRAAIQVQANAQRQLVQMLGADGVARHRRWFESILTTDSQQQETSSAALRMELNNTTRDPNNLNPAVLPYYARNRSKEVNNIRNTLPNGKLQANHLTSITGANGVPIQVHTSVQPHLAQMIAAAKAAGVNLSFVSGYRSYADQEYLHRTKPKGIAAAPGTSDHGWGMAIDLNRYSGNWEKTYSWLIKNMTKYGFAMIGPDRGFGALGKPGGVWNDESWHLAFTGRFNRGTA